MAKDTSWQPRNEKGQYRATGLADEAKAAGQSVEALAKEAARANVSVDALAKAFKKIRTANEMGRAAELAKLKLGMQTKEQEKAAKATAKANAAFAKEQDKVAKANDAIDFKPIGLLSEAMGKLPPQAQAAAFAVTMWATALSAAGAAAVATLGKIITLVQGMSLLQSRFMALARFGPQAGAATLESLKRLSKFLPFSEQQVTEWGQALMMAKLNGRDLENAVKAVAAAAALMGDSGAASAQALFETLARGGVEAASLVQTLKMGLGPAQEKLASLGLRVSDVAAALGMTVAQMKNARLSARQMAEAVQRALAVKAAGPLGELMLQWPNLIQKVKDGFASLFEKAGPDVKAFMKEMAKLFSMFGRGTPQMKAMQKVVTEALRAILKWGAEAVKFIAKWARENLTAAKIANAWKTVKSVFGTVASVVKAVVKVFVALWPIIKIVAVVGMILVGAALLIVGALLAVMAIVVAVAALLVGGLVAAIGAVIDAFSGLSKGSKGAVTAWGEGLIAGILSFAGSAASAAASVAGGIVGAFKSALGIASPSKVMMKMGGYASEGAAVGVEKGADRVEGAGAKLGGAMAGGAAGAANGSNARGKGGLSVTFADGAIRIDGAGKSGLEITEEMLMIVLEKLAASQGLARA